MSIAAAIHLASNLHLGQVDKVGRPYCEHLARVANYLSQMFPDHSEAEMEAAWLHDALEDTDATPEIMLHAGVTAEAVSIVQWLTRPAGMAGSSYLNWIRSIAKDGPIGAIRVKLADNRDNSDPARVAALPGGESMALTRYVPAREILEAALAKRNKAPHDISGHDNKIPAEKPR